MRTLVITFALSALTLAAADKIERRLLRSAETRGALISERLTERTVTTSGKGKKIRSATNDVERAGREFPVMFVTPRLAPRKKSHTGKEQL